MDLVVEGVHCGACISTIEKGLGREAGVRGARVNLASKMVRVQCYLHDDSHAPQGWYARAERTLDLSKPFFMS